MQLPGIRFLYGEDFYTDWFPRGGDNLLVRIQNLDSVGTVTVTATFYTKNHDEPGDPEDAVETGGVPYSVAMSNSDDPGEVHQVFITSTGAADEGLKELVRLRIAVTGSAGGSLLGRIFPPIFYDRTTPAS